MSVWLLTVTAVIATACAASGLLMLHQRVCQVAGWLLIAGGLVGLFGTWLLVGEGSRPVARSAFLIAYLVLIPAALWAYPRPLWRHPVDFVLGVLLVSPGLVAVVAPHDSGVITPIAALAILALIAQTGWRLETADRTDRRPLLWSSLALTCAGLFGLVLLFLVEVPDDRVLAVALAPLAAVPVAMAIGVLRPEMVEVRGLVVRAVLFIVLALGYITVFVGVVSLAEFIGAPELSLAALAVIGFLAALALHPAEVALRGVIDQLLFGDRPDPLGAATRVVGRMDRDPTTALEHIREDLKLPFVALLRNGQVVASSGPEAPHQRTVTVADADGSVVELVVGLRAGDLRLTTGDEHVLRLVAPLLVQVLRAEQLAADLQLSRGHAIATIEEERRRLRRDLHDGLGPTLTGIAYSTDAARNSLRTDPEEAEELLAGIRRDTADAIAQIRGLVYGMRPPALDELGLGPALRQQAAGLRGAEGTALPVTFDIGQSLPDLPAAVEVAAYRIVMEALTNIARHTAGAAATVRLSADGTVLSIEVADAAGPMPAWRPGVGVASMRERAAEVGGHLEAGPTPAGGLVRAQLPTDWGTDPDSDRSEHDPGNERTVA